MKKIGVTMNDFSDIINNAFYHVTADSFAPRPPQRIGGTREKPQRAQTGAIPQPNGDIFFNLFAPAAKTVEIKFTSYLYWLENRTLLLAKTENGFFQGLLPYHPAETGPRNLQVVIDGVPTLHSQLPVYFRCNTLSNYVEIPDPSCPEVLIQHVPHGSVSAELYWSTTMNSWQRCIVYTPAEYRHTDKKYPVLYLCHGAGENETSWTYAGKLPNIMDNLIASGACEPFLVVMNNGMVRLPEDGGKQYNGFSGMLLNDCIPFIEKEFRVKIDEWSRAIAGESMGGMETSFIGFAHPELFGYIGFLSGVIRCHDFWPSFAENPQLQWLINGAEKVAENFRIFYRSWGDVEWARNPWARGDEEFLAENGIDQLPCYHYNRYPDGEHEWGTFRKDFRDFAKLIFK